MYIIVKEQNKKETFLHDCSCIEYDKQKNKIIFTFIDGTQRVHYFKSIEDVKTIVKIKIFD